MMKPEVRLLDEGLPAPPGLDMARRLAPAVEAGSDGGETGTFDLVRPAVLTLKPVERRKPDGAHRPRSRRRQRPEPRKVPADRETLLRLIAGLQAL